MISKKRTRHILVLVRSSNPQIECLGTEQSLIGGRERLADLRSINGDRLQQLCTGQHQLSEVIDVLPGMIMYKTTVHSGVPIWTLVMVWLALPLSFVKVLRKLIVIN